MSEYEKRSCFGIEALDETFFEKVLAAIYDCAVDPSGWEDALNLIRDQLDLSYLLLHFFRFPPGYPDVQPEGFVVGTQWDSIWLARLEPLLPSVPHFDRMRNTGIDEPATQLQFMSEQEFQATDFYSAWVKPQGLRDNCLTNIVARDNMLAMLSGASGQERDVISHKDVELMAKLSPHIRRALLISDLLDESRTQAMFQSRILDGLSVSVFLVGQSGQISYANAAGEALLSRATLVSGYKGRLSAVARVGARALSESILRACTGTDTAIGLWGNGIPLCGQEGEAGVAYVLPLGRSDKRHMLGNGMAAVAITTRDDTRLPEIEVLTALSGLTAAEARMALAISQGRSLEAVADDNAIALGTVRKHLKSAYEKTGARSQHALGAYINSLQVPISDKTTS